MAPTKKAYYYGLQIGKLYKSKSALRANDNKEQHEDTSTYPSFKIYIDPGSILVPINEPYQPSKYKKLTVQYDFVDFLWLSGQYHFVNSGVTENYDREGCLFVNMAFSREFGLTVNLSNYFELIDV